VPPPTDKKATDVVFSASSEAAVVAGKRRVEVIMEGAIDIIPYTHFISVPLTSKTRQTKFTEFIDQSMKQCASSSRGSDLPSSSSVITLI
jgi:hypothetical protein